MPVSHVWVNGLVIGRESEKCEELWVNRRPDSEGGGETSLLTRCSETAPMPQPGSTSSKAFSKGNKALPPRQ